MNEDFLYKIGDTYGSWADMSILIKLQELLDADFNNPVYVHFSAVAAFNCRKIKEA